MPRGRKPLWEKKDMKNRLNIIKGWATMGLTEKEMYNQLGVSADTWENWKNDKPEFLKALRSGQMETVAELVESAKKQAQGYFVVEKTKRIKEHYNSEGELVSTDEETSTDKKYVKANSSVTKYLLNNLSNKFDNKATISHEVESLEDIFAEELHENYEK
ncbi:MAG: hypothetical protein ACQEQF_00620 [Bacillota bacterium]